MKNEKSCLINLLHYIASLMYHIIHFIFFSLERDNGFWMSIDYFPNNNDNKNFLLWKQIVIQIATCKNYNAIIPMNQKVYILHPGRVKG